MTINSEVVIGVIALIGSWGGAAFIAGFRYASLKMRLDYLERMIPQLATKDKLATVSKDVSEIKGMFRMTLRDSDGP